MNVDDLLPNLTPEVRLALIALVFVVVALGVAAIPEVVDEPRPHRRRGRR